MAIPSVTTQEDGSGAVPPRPTSASPDENASQNSTRRLYRMGSNENPLGPSPAVIEAIQRYAATLGDYPPFQDDTLRDALSNMHSRGLTPDHFATGNSGCDVLELIARVFLSAGDECIIFRPTFPVYEIQAQRQGAQIVHVDLESETFAYDVVEILAAVTSKTRIVYLCSPNNPTGSLLTASQLSELLAGLPREVLLVYDEVYNHFVNAADRPDPLAYVLSGANIVVVHSFSKAYGLAGLRLGYAITPPEIAERLSSIRRPFHLSTISLEAGKAAIADQAHVAKTVEVTLQGRDWLFGQLQELDLTVWPSQGNFLTFRCPVPAVEWAERLQEYGIIVRPAFGLPDCLRVTVGLPEANQALVAALEEMLSAA